MLKKRQLLDSFFLKELDDKEATLNHMDKEWKMSGIRQIFFNRLIGEVGKPGYGPGQFMWPSSLTVTTSGELVVKDSGNDRIQIFSSEGLYKHGFSYEPATIKCLGDVKATREGQLLISNGAKAIKVFAQDGRLIHQLTTSNVNWKHSYGLSVLPNNDLAVTDWSEQGKVHIMSRDWKENNILNIDTIEGFYRPTCVAVRKDDDVLVTEGQLFGPFEGRCIKVIGKDKTIQKKIGPTYGSKLNFINPSGICVDESGNILVADKGKNCVVMFNPDLSLSAMVVKQDLQGPCGLCLMQEGYLAVADCYHHNVKIYQYR
ncbi:E3 ubiquitin-protein ligase TRIM32-like [Chiloscyllium plagiosum]|uniref:E3 ubiquitin-protein ligase TRIM32-like n=1 Tax=Chiloscyllium plagiosum TaxID=36176 RepID=UPI001CB82FAA|nr:E3 ubiquitin-protein ligase TRIM32-like [Chiloscyllium plagiosum]